jgi:hypothetical protein
MRLASFTLVIDGRDDHSNAHLDRIEAAAGFPITAHREDGRGGMRFWLRPPYRPNAARRKAILDSVKRVCGLPVRWEERP